MIGTEWASIILLSKWTTRQLRVDQSANTLMKAVNQLLKSGKMLNWKDSFVNKKHFAVVMFIMLCTKSSCWSSWTILWSSAGCSLTYFKLDDPVVHQGNLLLMVTLILCKVLFHTFKIVRRNCMQIVIARNSYFNFFW